MRDKYLFEKNTKAASSGALKRQADLEALFAANKASRKLLSKNAYERMKTALPGTGGDTGKVHDTLHAYERDFLDIGNWPRFRGALRMRYPSMKVIEAPPDPKVELRGDFGIGEEVVGWIHLDHARFVPCDPARPDGALHDVYLRRGDASGRHYILLPDTDPPIFVRRYVVRGLNGHNAMDLDGGRAMRAAHVTRKAASMASPQPSELGAPKHPKSTKDTLTEAEQLLSHTRGWKKRYISAGVGNYAPLSTRGEAFTTLFGMVAIDLAKIADLHKVFDIHAPPGAKRYMGLEPTEALDRRSYAPAHTGVGADTYEGEKYLALRDVLRTRELVIKGDVPIQAVVRLKGPALVLAVGCTAQDKQDEVAGLLRTTPGLQGDEIERFTWSDQKRWCFALYGSGVSLNAAYNRVALEVPGQTLLRVSTYSFPRPAGMPLGN